MTGPGQDYGQYYDYEYDETSGDYDFGQEEEDYFPEEYSGETATLDGTDDSGWLFEFGGISCFERVLI